MTSSSPAEAEPNAPELIALSYVDNAGISRSKTVPAGSLAAAIEHGIGMSPVFDAFLSDDQTITTPDAGGPVGDLRLHPDPRRVAALPVPGLAWAPVDRRAADGSDHPQCHRSFLRRVVERASAQGLSCTLGFEIEWVIGRHEDHQFLPATTAPAYGLSRVSELGPYLVDVTQALHRAGLSFEQLHPEYAPGQFELSLAPSDPIGAADDVVAAQEVLRIVGHHHGLATSFAPVVQPGMVGNGRHVHVSARRQDEALLAGGPGPHGLTAEGAAFVAGLLEAIPAMVGIGASSPVSFGRLAPSRWSAPFVCWGLENREAALRLVTATRAGRDPSANVEWKNPDAPASPYLVAGAVIACGVDGIARGLHLPAEVITDPATLSPLPGDSLPPGCVAPFPRDANEALDALERSAVLAEALGGPLHRTFLAVRRAELAGTHALDPETLVTAYRFRY